MIVGFAQRCYEAPCRWYPGGPVGRIRFYWAKDGALPLPYSPTVFWPYQFLTQLENRADTGEITGKGLRRWYNGVNVNNLPGDHCEGTAEDFAGLGTNPNP